MNFPLLFAIAFVVWLLVFAIANKNGGNFW